MKKSDKFKKLVFSPTADIDPHGKGVLPRPLTVERLREAFIFLKEALDEEKAAAVVKEIFKKIHKK